MEALSPGALEMPQLPSTTQRTLDYPYGIFQDPYEGFGK